MPDLEAVVFDISLEKKDPLTYFVAVDLFQIHCKSLRLAKTDSRSKYFSHLSTERRTILYVLPEKILGIPPIVSPSGESDCDSGDVLPKGVEGDPRATYQRP